MMEIILSIALGLGLSAACGFRIFVPMLLMSVAARSGHLTLGDSWMWLGSDAALLVFASATVLEVCAYYIPVVDHALDVISAPVAIVAGTVASAAVFVDMSPLLKWTLAIVAGGGAASLTHAGKTLARTVVSLPTLGTGNWIVSTGEIVSAAGVSILSMVVPVVGFFLLLLLGIVGVVIYRHYRVRKDTLEAIPA